MTPFHCKLLRFAGAVAIAASVALVAPSPGQGATRTPPSGPSTGAIDVKNETCPVMGGKAKPDTFVDYEGVRVRLCCPGCNAAFLKEPAKYLKKLGIDDLDAWKKAHRSGGHHHSTGHGQ